MRVTDVMTEQVKAVPPTTLLTQANDIMKGSRINHLAVVDNGDLVGIISSRDLDSIERRKGGVRASVGDVMTRGVITVTPATPIRRAANVMRGRSVGSLLVMTGKRIVGIVTVADLLDLIGSGANKPVMRGKRWTLSHRTPHVKKAAATGVW